MNYRILAISILALAAIGWGVWNYDPRAVPLVIGSLIHVDLFCAGRRFIK